MISSGIRGSDIRTLSVSGYTPIRYNQCCDQSKPQTIEFNPKANQSAGIERAKQVAALQASQNVATRPSPFFPQQDKIIYFRPPIFNESNALNVYNVVVEKSTPFPTHFQTTPSEPVQLKSAYEIVNFPRPTQAWPAFSAPTSDKNFERFQPKQQLSNLSIPKFQKIQIKENRNIALEPTNFIPPKLNSFKHTNILPQNQPKPFQIATPVTPKSRIAHGFSIIQPCSFK